MSPEQVGACSFWQFNAAVAGWNATHAPQDDTGIGAKEADDLWQGVQDRMH